jgi:hypothetical protein
MDYRDYQFCVSSDAHNDDVFAAYEGSLAYAAYLLERDPDAAALLVNAQLSAMIHEWYAQQGHHPPASDQILRDLAERAPALAEQLRVAVRAVDVRERLRSAERLLGMLRALQNQRFA